MKFNVNNHEWELLFVNPNNPHLRRSDGSITLGVTDGRLKTVFIADNLSDYMTDKVLMHEMSHVHAIEYDYTIPIEIEEIVCDFMSLYGRNTVYTVDSIMDNILRRIA
jgi:hypothetical protein